jgi:hypothetical protein
MNLADSPVQIGGIRERPERPVGGVSKRFAGRLQCPQAADE